MIKTDRLPKQVFGLFFLAEQMIKPTTGLCTTTVLFIGGRKLPEYL